MYYVGRVETQAQANPSGKSSFYHILRIKTICQNPNKNILPYEYFLL